MTFNPLRWPYRRIATTLITLLAAAVLFSFVLLGSEQAEERRIDADVYARLRAISIAASDGSLTPRESNDLWNRASAEIINQLSRLEMPVVITDTLGNPTSWSHLPEDLPTDANGAPSVQALRDFVASLDDDRDNFTVGNIQVHVGDAAFLRRLRWLPWLQVASLVAILGGGGWLIWTSFRSERDRIWSSMARESAHQIGTPLSSLVGWLEVLETDPSLLPAPVAGGTEMAGAGVLNTSDVIDEMAADVERLRKVSRRFELIGRKPALTEVSIRDILMQLTQYFEARLPTLAEGRIDIATDLGEAPAVLGDPTLLEWAFENLMKNAIDALSPGGGRISVSYLGPNGRLSAYRVTDTGPGVPAHLSDKIFEIGWTTKEKGWGVGLSLTRRIITQVHGGTIHLEDTTAGASFRVELPMHAGRAS